MSKFETESCSRCSGTGKHSYCTAYADRCFKCGGSGHVHTKRGAVAFAFFKESLYMVADEIQAGYLIFDDYKTRKWIPITEIVERGASIIEGVRIPCLSLVTEQFSMGVTRGYKAQCVPSREALQEKLAAAVAYQATLTKTGKPSKKKIS